MTGSGVDSTSVDSTSVDGTGVGSSRVDGTTVDSSSSVGRSRVGGPEVSGLRRFASRSAATQAARRGAPPATGVTTRTDAPPGTVADPGTDAITADGVEAERCEMCRAVLDARHGHVVEIEKRSIVCACRACYLLFISDGAAGGRYRSVPERIRHDPARALDDADWNELQIPVAMAFFFYNSVLGRVVAGYPSPGGVTECELDLAAWDRLATAYPLLAAMAPDVEAIFVNRAESGSVDHGSADHGNEVFLIPIDECYALVGQLRMRWHGFDGGAEAHAALAAFLDSLRRRAVELAPGER